MDIKDKKLLIELSNDSRLPLTQLSKKVGISREVLNYRLKKLEGGIIKRYSSQINLQRLGFQRTSCYIELQKCSNEDRKNILNFLIQNKFVCSISTNVGKYDLIFDICYDHEERLQKVFLEIQSFLKEKIKEFFFISVPVKQKIFYSKIFGQKFKHIETKKTTQKKIDKIDLELLKILNKNSRTSLIKISEKIKLKPNAVSYRIKELEKNNIIENSTIFINFEKLNFEIYNFQIKITDFKIYEKIISFLELQDFVFYYYQYLGNKEWDIDVGIFLENKKELKLFLQKLKDSFGESINFKDIYLIDKLYKEEMPEGIFE